VFFVYVGVAIYHSFKVVGRIFPLLELQSKQHCIFGRELEGNWRFERGYGVAYLGRGCSFGDGRFIYCLLSRVEST
jgi:hypothetical protein